MSGETGFISLGQAATLLGVSEETLLRRIKRQRLGAIKDPVTGRYLINEVQVSQLRMQLSFVRELARPRVGDVAENAEDYEWEAD